MMAAKKSDTKKSDTPTNKVGEPVEHTAAVDDSSSVDRVAMVSYRADGTPDQTPGFIVKGQDADAGSEVVKTAPDDEA